MLPGRDTPTLGSLGNFLEHLLPLHISAPANTAPWYVPQKVLRPYGPLPRLVPGSISGHQLAGKS